MDIERYRTYCLNKKGVSESFPFSETALVFKVMGKMFALADIESHPLRINLKCEPEKALKLREEYNNIRPGYHQNKKHWNTLIADADLNDELIKELTDHSYRLVVSKLTKAEKARLEKM